MKNLGITLMAVILIFAACEPKSDLDKKLSEYEKAKRKLASQKSKVHSLKLELEEAGILAVNDNRSLVTTISLKPTSFKHTIDVRGTVKSRGNIVLSAETAGRVTKINVKEGEKVVLGQTLMLQDAEVLQNNIAELRTSLDLATTIYERQKKLWDKNIGSEVQYLQAKNNKNSLERKLATTRSQLAKSIIKAPFSGTIDKIDVRVGQNIQPGQSMVRLVSLADMYIKANISESFVGKFEKNQEVNILFPSIGKEMKARISAVGQVIEPKNRTFEIEIIISPNPQIKPNMVAVLSIADYRNEEALAVPTNIIFTDSKGVFVYQLKQSEGNDVAIRTDVTLGLTAGTETEIIAGLKEGDVIIDKGIYDISNGSQVIIAE